jgi:hypothetical protein
MPRMGQRNKAMTPIKTTSKTAANANELIEMKYGLRQSINKTAMTIVR